MIRSFIFSILFLISAQSFADTHNLNNIMRTATNHEKSNLAKLLEEATVKPETDPKTGITKMKVISVVKGSVYDRFGVKPGDYLITNSNSSSEKMEIKQSVKKVSSKR